MLIGGEIIKHVAKIDICHFAQGDDMRNADAALSAQSSIAVIIAPD